MEHKLKDDPSLKTKYIAWSHSRISDFEKCRRMFWYKSVDPSKRVKFKQTALMKDGQDKHKAFENRVAHGIPFPNKWKSYEPIAQAILSQPGYNMTEEQICFDSKFNPCGWFDKSAYLRVIIDILKINGTNAWAGDYKAGSPWNDSQQLKLTAAAVMQRYPEIENVATSYIWLKTGAIDSESYTRDELPQLWEELMVQPRLLHEATVMDHWPANPSQRNCGYCPVNELGLCDKARGRFRG